ncbi:pilus assembly protein TadG-related protein [Zavarzinia sp.]|uniref:pilus assembly protein TadG-related protein n=1 Tax=Zavarzinia sp. TaxID=2027920 RepID=UPI003BB4D662
MTIIPGSTTSRRHAGESGVAAILLAASLVVLLGMVAMVVDLGFAYFQRQRLQDTLDLAAISAARELSGQGATAAAYQKASAALADNLDNGESLPLGYGCSVPTVVGSVNICFGNYHADKDDNGNRPALVDRFQNEATNCNGCDAVRLYGRAPSPSFFATLFEISELDVAGVATAVKAGSPLAQLTLKSTLVTVDSTKSPLLNALFGGLLGGSVNLSVASWNGLVGTSVSLLDYLDVLAVDLGLGAGNYDDVLNAPIQVGDLLGAMADVLGQGSPTSLQADAIAGLVALQAVVPAGWSLALGSILDVATGTSAAGLDTGLNVFSLVQATIEAANGRHGLEAGVPISVPGVGSVTLKLSVIEPPQLSAIGNPALAKANPLGADRIFVRSAQVRAVVSVNLPALSSVVGLVNAVLSLAGPVTTLLNDVLHLNLVSALTGLVGSLVGIPYQVTDIQLVPGNPIRIDVSLDVGAGQAWVTDYNCPNTPADTKRLSVSARTSAANLRVGRIDLASVFSSTSVPTVSPIPLVDFGVKTCRVFLLVVSTCEPRRAFEGGGMGLAVNTDVAGSDRSLAYADPNLPDIGHTPYEQSTSSTDIVASLSSTLAHVTIQSYGPSSPAGGLGGLLNLVGSAVNTVVGLLQTAISNLLSPLLDPIVNFLLDFLGIDIAKISVGANLTCNAGARLVN